MVDKVIVEIVKKYELSGLEEENLIKFNDSLVDKSDDYLINLFEVSKHTERLLIILKIIDETGGISLEMPSSYKTDSPLIFRIGGFGGVFSYTDELKILNKPSS